MLPDAVDNQLAKSKQVEFPFLQFQWPPRVAFMRNRGSRQLQAWLDGFQGMSSIGKLKLWCTPSASKSLLRSVGFGFAEACKSVAEAGRRGLGWAGGGEGLGACNTAPAPFGF